MRRKIVIVAEDYPSEGNPSYPFVQELAYCLSNEGFDCSVIAPQSISKTLVHREKLLKRKSVDISPDGKEITVYRPYIVTFSNASVGFIEKLVYGLYRRAIGRTIRKMDGIEFVYCYFWHIGLITARALEHSGLKLIVQASECDISIIDSYNKAALIDRVNGVVCASRKNYDESADQGLIDQNSKTVIIPNGFRPDEFHPMDKKEARRRLGIDENAFVVAFVGDYNERKGVARLSEAIDRFDDVYSLFIGKGNIKPACRNILFQGTVPHKDLCLYLNCADVFALPTQAEGSCNAIIEAVACGLPVISSNKPFNDEILDDRYSIRINENSVDEIAASIQKLKEDPGLRMKMSENARLLSSRLDITHRGRAVADFLDTI